MQRTDFLRYNRFLSPLAHPQCPKRDLNGKHRERKNRTGAMNNSNGSR